MKTSFYNFIFNYEDESQSVLYNSLYGSLILIDTQESAIIEGIFDNPNQENIDQDIYTVLCNERFIISDDINEVGIVENRKRLGIDDPNRLDIVIMPTLNCNFSCSYCYENHLVSTMTDKTEGSLMKWLQRIIPAFKFVLLHWYGGEPLIEIKRLIRITSFIKSVAIGANVDYSFHITSNGYLFTKENIKQIISNEIFDFQITVDGTEDFHNSFRPLKNGKPTFPKVYHNIVQLAEVDEKVKISLRINFNHLNIDSIPALLDQFPPKIRKQLRVNFEPIFGNCSVSAVNNIANSVMSNKLAGYYGYAEDLGYDVILGLSSLYTGKLVYCYAERKNQYIINYNGDVFKCSVGEFQSHDRVGFIDESGVFIKEFDNYSKWVSQKLFSDKCYACKYLPLCMGGCRKRKINYDDTGSVCDLVPTNTSYLLKQIAFEGLNNLIKKEVL